MKKAARKLNEALGGAQPDLVYRVPDLVGPFGKLHRAIAGLDRTEWNALPDAQPALSRAATALSLLLGEALRRSEEVDRGERRPLIEPTRVGGSAEDPDLALRTLRSWWERSAEKEKKKERPTLGRAVEALRECLGNQASHARNPQIALLEALVDFYDAVARLEVSSGMESFPEIQALFRSSERVLRQALQTPARGAPKTSSSQEQLRGAPKAAAPSSIEEVVGQLEEAVSTIERPVSSQCLSDLETQLSTALKALKDAPPSATGKEQVRARVERLLANLAWNDGRSGALANADGKDKSGGYRGVDPLRPGVLDVSQTRTNAEGFRVTTAGTVVANEAT